jgi:hypothetical protein
VSDIDTAVVDGLKVLDPNGRLEKLPRRLTVGGAVDDPKRRFAGINACDRKGLIDHIVGDGEQRRRHGEAERLCRFDVDH